MMTFSIFEQELNAPLLYILTFNLVRNYNNTMTYKIPTNSSGIFPIFLKYSYTRMFSQHQVTELYHFVKNAINQRKV